MFDSQALMEIIFNVAGPHMVIGDGGVPARLEGEGGGGWQC